MTNKIKNNKIFQQCKKIKLVLSDVDGVLTDGGMYYSEKGEAMKKFNTRDSMGMELLRNVGIPTVLITRENSTIVKKRAKKIKVELYSKILDKKKILPIICSKYNVIPSQIAYIGDDVNDLQIMKEIGFKVAPYDAVEKIKEISDYLCTLKGGEGAFRELSDLILKYND
jgi:3-deoxy-D-manno-octulosonate 8-phosphate phosphatase (KDO 8-P phosphatase)